MLPLPITRPGIVVPVRVDSTGVSGPTRAQARGPRWRRLGDGWQVPSDVDSSVDQQRIVEAVVRAPEGAAVTGWAALNWLGGRWFGGSDAAGAALDIPIALGDRRNARPRDGVALCEDWLFADDVVRIDGLPITVPERSVSFEARRSRGLVEAVRVIEMAAYDDLIDIVSFRTYVERLGGRAGVCQLRDALALAGENVWSPMETRMRMLWTLEFGRGPLLCNAPVFDLRGRHLFTPDLLDPAAGVAGEYSGEVHAGAARRRADLDRDERGKQQDIEFATMVAGDAASPYGFFQRLRGAYARAERHRGPRRWTLEQPHWWVDTSTVAARRALTADQRAIWLRRLAD